MWVVTNTHSMKPFSEERHNYQSKYNCLMERTLPEVFRKVHNRVIKEVVSTPSYTVINNKAKQYNYSVSTGEMTRDPKHTEVKTDSM